MRPSVRARLNADRAALQASGRWRRREALARIDAVTVARGKHRLINFCGNDYLGLAAHPALLEAMASGAATGSGASALVAGHAPVHAELEARLAGFLGFDAALVVGSGYQANLALGQALLERGDRVLADRLNHASLNDGARLAGARIDRYRHADAAHAARRAGDRTRWLCTDGVFSMDGDIAPLPDLAELADKRGLGLWLDDAHGVGVLGDTGRGSLELLSVAPTRIDAFVVTFGKALGTQGAAICGDRALIEALINRGRGIIYSTAMALPLAAATIRALTLVETEAWRRERLAEHVARFRDRAAALKLSPSVSAIQPIIVGPDARAVALADALTERGYLVRAIRPPTVPEGTARLRVTLSALHRTEHIDGLVRTLLELMQ
jgi:8-amino-7-oxononanoate synthase